MHGVAGLRFVIEVVPAWGFAIGVVSETHAKEVASKWQAHPLAGVGALLRFVRRRVWDSISVFG